MLVGKATKTSEPVPTDPKPVYLGEEGYRDKAENYLHAKIDKYNKRIGNNFELKDAVRRAINKEGGRFPEGVTINHPLTGALINFSEGDQTVRISTRVLVPDNSGNHYVRLGINAGSPGCSVSRDNKKCFRVIKVCAKSVEIPVEGILEIMLSNDGGTGLSGKIAPVYSMAQHIAEMAQIDPNGRFIHTLDLFSQAGMSVITAKRLPVTQLLFNVALRDGNRVFLEGIAYKVMLAPDVHEMMYTTHFRPEADPAFDRSVLASEGSSSKMHVSINDKVFAEINEHVALLAGSSGATRVSLTISRGEEMLYSKSGTERWEFAHAGEALVALKVIRLAAAQRGSRTVEQALSDPAVTVILLKQAKRHRLLDALASVVGGIANIPSILALATHSSGLPHEGCYDVECSPSVLDAVLPCDVKCASLDPNDAEGLVAHSIACRCQMLSAPDCKVRRSLLGYSVLACCLPGDPAVHIKKMCKEEFSMVSTTLKHAVLDATRIPGDVMHRVSRLLESTTNDMCRLFIGCERARVDVSAHEHLRLCMLPKYLIKDQGRLGLHAVTHGGWETITVRIKHRGGGDNKKRSHLVLYRIGDRADRSCTVMFYVPGMHVGLVCALDSAFDRIFGRHSHAQMRYGKSNVDKTYYFKHFVKHIIGRLPHECVNRDAEIAFSVTPHYPAASSSYKADCDSLAYLPDKHDTHWNSVLMTSEPFRGSGFPFYPLELVMHKLIGAGEAVVDFSADVLSGLLPIHVHHSNGVFYLTDMSLDRQLEMRWDPRIRHSMGLECASRHKLSNGAFRVRSHEFEGEFGSVLSIHPFSDGGKDAICIVHRGCTYVSEPFAKSLFERVRIARAERITSSISEENAKKAMALRPWLAAAQQNQKTVAAASEGAEHIGRGIGVGGAIAAGALAGLATSAVVAPALYRPRYYYGPRVYPPPYYPYGYPYPYY